MNQNLKTIVIPLIVTLIVLCGNWLFGGKSDTAITPAQQSAITQTVTDALGGVMKSGALSSPAIGPWFSYGDIIHDGASVNFDFTGSATSTGCAIQSPAATSTLTSAVMRIVTEPYPSTWKIFRAGTPTTQTTLLAQDLAATASGIVNATTTNTALVDGTIPPLSWVNFVAATTTAVNANFNAVIRCEATFREL